MSLGIRMDLSLLERQQLFALSLGKLLVWISQQGWAVTMGEGHVADTDRRDGDHDGPHMRGGTHYFRLGQDLNLFVGGEWRDGVYEGGAYITDGGHPAWAAIGAKWETYHPLLRWGGRFKSRDSNHVSCAFDGKA